MSHREDIHGTPAAGGARGRSRSIVPAGGGRAALRLAVLAAATGFALVAASQGRPDMIASRLGLAGVTNDGKVNGELANLAGFQRRGNSLVGEVRTREGVTMRLVLDARTHTLIGVKVLEAAEAQAHPVAEARNGCPAPSTIAPAPLLPLPTSTAPAN